MFQKLCERAESTQAQRKPANNQMNSHNQKHITCSEASTYFDENLTLEIWCSRLYKLTINKIYRQYNSICYR